jgi:hypothetical protein
LFDIGTDLLVKQSLDGAIKYLRWSWDHILKITRVERLSVDVSELSINIRHNMAKALIRRGIGEEMDLDRAKELVDGLALVWGSFAWPNEKDRPKHDWMYLLKLEYLEKRNSPVDTIFGCIPSL